MIRKSFIATGIMNDFDGSEDECFKFPTIVSDYIEDDMGNLNIINNNSYIDYDNLNNKNRYNIKKIREEVMNDNKEIIFDQYGMDIENDSIKNYHYYSALAW